MPRRRSVEGARSQRFCLFPGQRGAATPRGAGGGRRRQSGKRHPGSTMAQFETVVPFLMP